VKIDGWRYYNHAAVPVSGPHEHVDLLPVEDGSIWKIDGSPVLARWITDWDCASETNWWYVIKDTPFKLSALKSKRRYEINKGNKNYTIRRIDSKNYANELLCVTLKAYEGWPKKYRPVINKDKFIESVNNWDNRFVYGAFFNEDDSLCGYGVIADEGTWLSFRILRTIPEHECNAINAALIYGILTDLEQSISQGKFICDGARSINHETSFQDYLEKYFDFRKAYCKLNIKYKRPFSYVVRILYPFRKIIKHFDNIGIIHRINGVLEMERVVRWER